MMGKSEAEKQEIQEARATADAHVLNNVRACGDPYIGPGLSVRETEKALSRLKRAGKVVFVSKLKGWRLAEAKNKTAKDGGS